MIRFKLPTSATWQKIAIGGLLLFVTYAYVTNGEVIESEVAQYLVNLIGKLLLITAALGAVGAIIMHIIERHQTAGSIGSVEQNPASNNYLQLRYERLRVIQSYASKTTLRRLVIFVAGAIGIMAVLAGLVFAFPANPVTRDLDISIIAQQIVVLGVMLMATAAMILYTLDSAKTSVVSFTSDSDYGKFADDNNFRLLLPPESENNLSIYQTLLRGTNVRRADAVAADLLGDYRGQEFRIGTLYSKRSKDGRIVYNGAIVTPYSRAVPTMHLEDAIRRFSGRKAKVVFNDGYVGVVLAGFRHDRASIVAAFQYLDIIRDFDANAMNAARD